MVCINWASRNLGIWVEDSGAAHGILEKWTLPPGRVGLEDFQNLVGFLGLKNISTTLVIHLALRGQLLGRGNVELFVEHGVARRVFIHVGGPVTDPLTRNKDR